MEDNKAAQSRESQPLRKTNEGSGNEQPAGDQQKPNDRLKDGTNDFVNGDQEENSEESSNPGAGSHNS